MQDWILQIMDQYGYLGIFLTIALENLFPPIPSEIILTSGGFLTTYANVTVIGVITAATLGSIVGAIILYWVGRLFDIEFLKKLVDRWGRVLRLRREDLDKTNAWFQRYGYWTVLFCRMVPLIRSLISIPAGMARLNFGLFLLFTTIGTLIWNTILVCLGAMLGENWESIVQFMEVYSTITYILLAVLFLLVIFIWLAVHRRSKK